MNTQEYEARFNPSEDDENMMALANDLASLMHNSNYLGRAMSENDKRMDTIDNIIADLVGRLAKLEEQMSKMENYLFRDKADVK
jgi:predicted  nucleic acid-binding Zn-ribbon protein